MHISYDVPSTPVQYSIETDEQLAAWKHAREICEPVTVDVPGEDCIEALGRYFLERPVWDSPNYVFYHGGRGITGVLTMINSRKSPDDFGYDDYAIEQIPLWRDIFDGQFAERKDKFIETMSDPTCIELADMTKGGIDLSKNMRCEAREMYKYSEFIDACFAAYEVLLTLRKPSKVKRYAGFTQFEESFLVVEEKILDPEMRNLAERSMERGYPPRQLDRCEVPESNVRGAVS